MTEEEKKEIYKKAFDCANRNSAINEAVLNTIIQLENRYTLRGDPHHDNQVLKILFNEEIFQTKLKTAIDEKSKQEEAFKKLKNAVTGNKKVIKQIEGLKRNKGIAIIGNNYDLISGIASYLWLTSPLIYTGTPPIWQSQSMSPIKQKFFDAVGKYINGKNGFCYINCDGVNETKLYEELFPDLTTMPNLPGSVLFLRNINKSHDDIVKRVLGIMRDVGGQGNFIISTDHLPVNLKNQFEVIELEPEKQGETTSKKIPRGQKQPYADKNEFDKFLISIIEESRELSLLRLAKKAIVKMNKEKCFLDVNGNSPYKELTLKNKIHNLKKGLKRTKPSFSKLKNDGKVTVKKRHLKSDVKT